MHTSKAFRCALPTLRDDQVKNLARWAVLHCAQSSIFLGERGSVVLVGLKDEFRTSASFARTVRTALRRLCIDVPLRGRWCTLITPNEAMSICACGAARGAALPPGGEVDAGARDAARFASPREDDTDVRVVALLPPSRFRKDTRVTHSQPS